MSLNTLARRYVSRGEESALQEARVIYHSAANDEERGRLEWWWNEGCRDYAEGMAHLDELNALLLVNPEA